MAAPHSSHASRHGHLPPQLSSCARCFEVVGDITKLRLCCALMHNRALSVNELARNINAEQSLVSHALRKLLAQEIVRKNKRGRNVYYQLNKRGFAPFLRKYILSITSCGEDKK